MSVQLLPMPGTKPFRILVGGPVRKPAPLVKAFFASLDRQILPPNVTLDYCFCDDNEDPAAGGEMLAAIAGHGGTSFAFPKSPTPDYDDAHRLTHQWTVQSMRRVGAIKNAIIQKAIEGNYDALWLVDADLILGLRTLWSLYYADAPIVCGVFWTKWMNVADMEALPQVWLRHPYELDGRGKDRPAFLRELATHQRVQVWGQGACTLYRTEVFRKGVSFEPVPGTPEEGMWQGEDRQLCIRAERLHVPMVADAWPSIWHAYHTNEHDQVEAWLDRLGQEEPGSPGLDSWVSLIVQALEPVPTERGPLQIQPQHVRGQVGRLNLAPELEAHVRQMQRGEKQIVSVEFPTWSPVEPYRGQRRLLEVMLVDWRSEGRAPGL